MSDDGYGDDSGGFNDGEGFEQNIEDLDEDNEFAEVNKSIISILKQNKLNIYVNHIARGYRK